MYESPDIAAHDKEPGSSPHSPAPVGTTIKTTIEQGDLYSAPQFYDVEITLLDIYRGDEAQGILDQAQGKLDGSPQEGFDVVLCKIKFGYYNRRRGRGAEIHPFKVTESQFKAMSSDMMTFYDNPPLVKQPQPSLIGCTFTPGDSAEGWIVVQIPKNEEKPFLIFRRGHDGAVYGIWEYLWFSLFKKGDAKCCQT